MKFLSFKTISSSFGENIKVTISGGSHEPYVAVEIEGLPDGIHIDTMQLCEFTQRRAPGNSIYATPRKEPDIPEFLAGVRSYSNTDFAKEAANSNISSSFNFVKSMTDNILITTGEPLKAIIRNTNTRSGDYAGLRDVPRPGHADYTAYIKYGDSINMAGGGPFSARMTAPLCIAGGIALQILKDKGICIGAHIKAIGNVQDESFDPVNVQAGQLDMLKALDFPVINSAQGLLMKEEILSAMKEQDSVGGVIEAAITGLPAGLGGPMYDGVESRLAPILFGIPAVKGVEFGNGFEASTLRGSQNNDPFTICARKNDEISAGNTNSTHTQLDAFSENLKTIKTTTNNHGGILGGITSGMPLICRLAFKPTPSIGKTQQSVSISNMKPETLQVQGRHDPCVAVRAVPIVEAALAIGILDLLFSNTNK